MPNSKYKLVINDKFLAHSFVQMPLVHDSDDDDHRELEIDALVASGDCFVMLATALDQLTGEPYSDENAQMKPQLEKYVHTLLYLQRYYDIVRKPPEFRQ